MAAGRLPIGEAWEKEGIPQIPEETLAKIRKAFSEKLLPSFWMNDIRIAISLSSLVGQINPLRAEDKLLPILKSQGIRRLHEEAIALQPLTIRINHKKIRDGRFYSNDTYRILLPDVDKVTKILRAYNPFHDADDAKIIAQNLASLIQEESQGKYIDAASYVSDLAKSYLLGMHSLGDVDDLAQEVITEIGPYIYGFRGEFLAIRALNDFVYRSCWYQVIDHARKKGKELMYEEEFDEEHYTFRVDEDDADSSDLASNVGISEDLLEYAFQNNWISPDQFDAMKLYFSDKTKAQILEEIAQASKAFTWGAVRTRVRRGRVAILLHISGKHPLEILSMADSTRLSAKENEVLESLKAGKGYGEIAANLGMNPGSVHALYEKFLSQELKRLYGFSERFRALKYRSKRSMPKTTAQVWEKLIADVEALHPDSTL